MYFCFCVSKVKLMQSRIKLQKLHFTLWSILRSEVKSETAPILSVSRCVFLHSGWGDPLWLQPGSLQSGGPGSPGERAERRHSLPAGGAQRLPAAASPWIPGQLHDGVAAQPGAFPGGRPLHRRDAHGDQNQGHTHQLRGEETL